MIVSHEKKFIIFPDPLGASDQLMSAISPWADNHLIELDVPLSGTSPIEAEWSFDSAGLAFGSYCTIAFIENPFTRLFRLYERIRKTDRFWKLRETAGLPPPTMSYWLEAIKTRGRGAGGRGGPRWRKFGAWSAKHWMDGRIDFPVRLEQWEDDLTPILGHLGIAPSFDASVKSHDLDWHGRFDALSTRLILQRYAWDMAQFSYTPPQRVAA